MYDSAAFLSMVETHQRTLSCCHRHMHHRDAWWHNYRPRNQGRTWTAHSETTQKIDNWILHECS